MRGTTNVPSCYVLIRKDDKILFVLRENTGYMDGMYALPSGHVEAMESFSAAAAREALEEVGVAVDLKQLRHIHTLHRMATEGDHVRTDVFFEADEWSGKPANMEPDKHSKIEWFTVSQLPANIMDYQAHALKQVALGKTYSEIGWKTTWKGITLIGMPAAGKATVARVLAGKLNWPIYDIDDMMVEKEQRSTAETTRAIGRDYLLELEGKCVAELDLNDSVLATPGSIIYVLSCHDQLKEQTHIVWLDVELDVIRQRLAYDPNNDRGVVGLEDAGLDKLFAERQPMYEALADVRIKCETQSPDAISEEIIKTLNLDIG